MPTIEGWAEDALAVLDAVGSSRAALLGVASAGAAIAMVLSATYPERIRAQVLLNGTARVVRDWDYPCGWPEKVIDNFVESVPDPSYQGDRIDDLVWSAPSLATNAEVRSWWKRAGERATPPAARAMDLCQLYVDVRAVLPLITTPTLVLHRVDDPFLPVAHARYLADHIAGAKLVELPGKDHLPFAGDADAVLDEVEEFLTGARGPAGVERVLATVLFADVVDSTKRAASSGDRRWGELLDDHDRMAERQVNRFGGRQVKTTGDGILATFDGPGQAIRCGSALRDGARGLGLEVRVGIHTGEVERRGADLAGIGVHIAARVQLSAQPGEVWVSRTVTDLVAGSGIVFIERGEHELKGVPGVWQLFSVVD
jgi:class 3 adenylate cyclase